ncbi:alpha-1-macroglobulin [Trichonephila clavata]|uniref:TEP1-F n=2 Tax=Trichonephila clavata TaxID=2740835 RepID=A0A8X6GXF6_TRICU|nr:alpha-1-macroglobulin [Trichonephila clavata]
MICTAQKDTDNGYILTSPRTLKVGSNNQLQLFRSGCLEEGFLKVSLYYSNGMKGDTLLEEQDYQLEKGKKDSLLTFFVNPVENDYIYNGKLQINGTLCGSPFNGSDGIILSMPKKYILLIQTDKPLYKPGQLVKFRVLKIDQNFRPSNKKNDTVDVFVDDPKGTRLFQFKGIDLGKGIQQMQFPLSNEPTLGKWSIMVSKDTESDRTTFDVKKYKLPKFDVSIKFPTYVLITTDIIPVEICAKYTYGKPVQGTLNVNSSLTIYEYPSSVGKTPIIHNSVKIDGCYNYTLNYSLIDPSQEYHYKKIRVSAKVLEDETGVERSATQDLSRLYTPLSMDFDLDSGITQYFKPGLPFTGKLKVSYPYGSPAEGEPVKICATVTRERVIEDWLAKKETKFCRNYTTDSNGTIKYVLQPLNTDSVKISLRADSLKYSSRSSILEHPFAYHNLNPFYSPSGSFIQLENVDKSLPCGKQKKIRLLFTSKENSMFKFNYQILAKEKVVYTGTKEVSFHVEDDVSGKFFNDNVLINESQTQLIPAPKSSSSSDSSSVEQNCPGTKDARYTPPVGEVYIPINVDTSMSPSFKLLVFYVREDREIIADSQKIQVEKCFKNKVDFEFGDEEKQPGTQTTVRVTSAPNSLCGLKIVDKSISILDSSDQLTKDKLFQRLQRMDPNNYEYYGSDPCNAVIPQPGLKSSQSFSGRGSSIYTRSIYDDAYGIFTGIGYLVISNLILFSRPCSGDGFGSSDDLDYVTGEYLTAEYETGEYDTFEDYSYMSAMSNVPAPFTAKAASITSSVKNVRDYFPETWLFQMEMTGPDGVFKSQETLPDTITEWEGSAVCINSKDGLGLSDTASIKGFQAFFISYNLPISVIRGEEFVVTATIFSYVDAALPVTVSLDEPQGFVVANDSTSGDLCIQPNTSDGIELKLKATKVGKVNITVRAETISSSKVCGNSPIYDAPARDAITQSFEVEAGGFPNEKVHTILVCPSGMSMSLSLTDNPHSPTDVLKHFVTLFTTKAAAFMASSAVDVAAAKTFLSQSLYAHFSIQGIQLGT